MVKKRKKKSLVSGSPLSSFDIVSGASDQLLIEAKSFWFFGDWQALINIPEDKIESHAERANIILLVASGYQQLGDFLQAERYCRTALEWGCDNKSVAKVCIAGAYNIIGRIAALQGDETKLKVAFLAAVDVGSKKDTELVAHSRAVREMASLGLLPQAAGLVDNRIKQLAGRPSEISNVASSIRVLQTELELLTHELSLGQQRLQIYSNAKENKISTFKAGTDSHVEYLKKKSVSQLGQDLWVLEKTNYKRDGFFVEFGATDGVLLSNSYLLEKEFGWNGVCAEPNKKFFNKLKHNRKCAVSDKCIGGISGQKVSFVFADAYGGMVKHANDDNHNKKRNSYMVSGCIEELVTISLDDFLELYNAPRTIDYMSVDTEGSEYEILSALDFSKWNVKLLTVEHNYTNNQILIEKLLFSKGYKKISAQWDDWYYLEEEKSELS